MEYYLKNDVYVWIPDDELCYVIKNKFVLQVIAPQPEGHVGGSDTHVLLLAYAQKTISKFAPIVLFKRNKEYEGRLKKRKIAYICGINASDIEIAEALEDIDNIVHISIIHSHQYDANFLTQTIKEYCNALKDTFTVMTCHGWIENNEQDIIETEKDFLSYRYADILITVCEKDMYRLKSDLRYKEKPIFCVCNGVSIPFYTDPMVSDLSIRMRYGICADDKILAFVGRLAPEKRVDRIIMMFNELSRLRKDVYLLIVGNGDELNHLLRLRSQNEAKERIIFTGFVEDTSEIYRILDLLILMSDTEGTPRCVLECMAHGKIAVVTNVGGVHEIINSGIDGIIMDNYDLAQWAISINNLLDDKKKLIEMQHSAREKVINCFSIEDMTMKIENIYMHLKKGL